MAYHYSMMIPTEVPMTVMLLLSFYMLMSVFASSLENWCSPEELRDMGVQLR